MLYLRGNNPSYPLVRGHGGFQKQCGHFGEEKNHLLLPEIEDGSSVGVRVERQKVVLETFRINYTDRALRMK
jgi:hypothetical protein